MRQLKLTPEPNDVAFRVILWADLAQLVSAKKAHEVRAKAKPSVTNETPGKLSLSQRNLPAIACFFCLIEKEQA